MEIHVAEARFPEIMSWDEWKAKARSLEPRCTACGSPPKQEERDVLSLTGMCESCATKTDTLSGTWRELCKSP